jgi:hypothetical protein
VLKNESFAVRIEGGFTNVKFNIDDQKKLICREDLVRCLVDFRGYTPF